MSKKNAGGKKAPFNSAEEAKAKIEELKGKLETAKEERKTFAKDKGLSGKSENFAANAADAKHGKTWKKMTEAIEAFRKEKEEAETWLKENKPKKEAAVRETKYEYPANATDSEKKKIRAAARAAAKSTEKAAKKEDKAKSKEKEAKSEKKDAKPAADAKPSKEAKKEKTEKKTEKLD